MLVGALQSLWEVRNGVFSSFGNLAAISRGGDTVEREQQDLSLLHLSVLLVVIFFSTVLLYNNLVGGMFTPWVVTVLILVAAFVFVALASYIVGLVGSSHSPVSGMTICALLVTSGVVLALGLETGAAALSILGVAGVVCCATCTAGDVSQDLKTGYLIKATPFKQQVAEMIGVVAAAPFFALILSLLNESYGIGTGEPGALSAPQAALFASLTRAIIGEGELPLNMVALGAGLAVLIMALNPILKRAGSSFRMYVMPVAVGLYLPLSLTAPILLGGLLRYYLDKRKQGSSEQDGGVLYSSGRSARESLTGFFIAILITQQITAPWAPLDSSILSLLGFAAIVYVFWRLAKK